ncbi:MAG: hypothetical protein ABI690_06875 [Chloroflexota bacterium]
MYSVVSEQIIEIWLEKLTQNEHVNQEWVNHLRELVQQNELANPDKLKQAIHILEGFYDVED